MGRRSQSGKHTGHWAEHPIVDSARHGTYGCWPSEIPDQRGSGTAGVDHGIIRPCKSLRNRTQCLLGTPLARPWGGVHCRARIRGLGTSLPSSRARGTARTAPGRVKPPTRSSSDHASTGAGGQKSTVGWTPYVPSEEGMTSLREKFLKISKTHKYKVQPCFFSLSRGSHGGWDSEGQFYDRGRGDESVRRGAGSQWIVAARPLCHLQCPVAYLSRLQRIQPAGRWEFRSKGAPRLLCRAGRGLRHVPVGAQAPLLWVGRQPTGAGAASLAWILT